MTHEKTFTLGTGRSVKVIAKALRADDKAEIETQIEVLIKEPKEENYRLPIGTTHPKYWKLKRLDSRQIQILQIAYSGVTEKQIRKTVKEFKARMLS